ncbi:preprotein translocase subunit SecG [Xylanibacter muris]|uniref:Protein-export membrane protein SecG n=1 Tax=Xylanibacter muris TaxID=2736290 RepID=A0ABX2AKB7_9BACT|nr:preprotein translocase subunit SecG [Xylanibacter muris]NPD91185.1 preprotein translocase subunit SecG [Xylanibacter muris]
MYTLLVILICIAALLMIGIVLIQESKGGGLSSSFASYNQIGGVRKTTDFIEKTTWGLAVAMVVISIACAYVVPQATTNISVMEGVENPTTNPNNLPGFGASKTNPATPAANGNQKAEPNKGGENNAATEAATNPAK